MFMVGFLSWVKYLLAGVIFLFLITPSLSQSQPAFNSPIKWLSPASIITNEGKEQKVPDFAEAYHEQKNSYLPSLKIYVYKNVASLEILDAQYIALTPEEIKLVDLPSIGADPQVRVEVSSTRRTPYSIIDVVPFRRNTQTGQVEKLTNLSYSLNLASDQSAPSAQRGMNGYASASVLAQGDWYKLVVTESGIYKIDAALLGSMGIDIASLNPNNVAIYGNGGMLPQAWSPEVQDDLAENAIYVEGGSDNQFNSGDYILFYAKGPDSWALDSSSSLFNHQKNFYSDTAYYFLTVKGTPALRVQAQASQSGAIRNITTYDYRLFYEKDLENVLKSGRGWYGEKFDVVTDRVFSFDIPGIAAIDNLHISASVMASAFSPSSFTITANGVQAGSVTLPARSRTPYAPIGTADERLFTLNAAQFANNPKLDIRLQYNRGAASGTGYLNFLRVQLKRRLALYDKQTAFRSLESLQEPFVNYVLENAPQDTRIWDITNPLKPADQQYSRSGESIIFGAAGAGVLREYVAFAGSSFEQPKFTGKVANQNLHALSSKVPDLIIITVPEFLGQANKLAEFRRSFDKLDAEVVTVQQIYNEFSSGAQDLTAIRNFAKMLYDVGGNKFKYMLLLGDGSYDYKKSNASGNTNYVPIYEAHESLDPIRSYSSDDYIGILEQSSEGWVDNKNYPLDIGIGRLPVKSAQEAEVVVTKVISYSQDVSALGKWRNQMLLIADDGDNNLHLRDAETLHKDLNDLRHDVYNVNKVYVAAYPEVPGPGGSVAPLAYKGIEQAVEDGCLIVNFSGHGNTEFWTDERIMDKAMIQNWTNKNKLTFFVTATCDFGKYDNPDLVSGGEMIMLSEKGAGIGLLTSSRPVYSGNNLLLNRAFYRNVFTPVDGVMPRLGDVQRLTKNSSMVGSSNRNFALLGDPSMKLAYPQENLLITKVNDKPVQAASDTIKALQKVSMQGEVRNSAGQVANDFNGLLNVTVFDKESEITTIPATESPQTVFRLRRNIIFDGNVKVTNGIFGFTFVVPKDISYVFGNGKVSMYAQVSNSARDAHGAHNNVTIGGGADSVAPDNTPPVIRLYMNDSSFVFGGTTGPSPKLLARLNDENGINVSSTGVGHEITAILNNDRENILVLNRYYTADTGAYTSGTVDYDLKNLALGRHSVSVKAWDTHNNSAETYLEFLVADDASLALDNVLNFPNPFTDYTTFHFDHNHAGRDLDVQVQIFTISGKLIKTLSTNTFGSTSHVGSRDRYDELSWDGRDEFGDKIGRGVYIYKLNVRSSDGSKAHKVEKLVILK
jgi:hypothetical protein